MHREYNFVWRRKWTGATLLFLVNRYPMVLLELLAPLSDGTIWHKTSVCCLHFIYEIMVLWSHLLHAEVIACVAIYFPCNILIPSIPVAWLWASWTRLSLSLPSCPLQVSRTGFISVWCRFNQPHILIFSIFCVSGICYFRQHAMGWPHRILTCQCPFQC